MYDFFLDTPAQKYWSVIGLKRRSGVCTPLFSVYSKKSTGIGDFSDLKLLVSWCRKTALSLVQLLPLNDTGIRFKPYDSQSSFALDPMYADLEKITGVEPETFHAEIQSLRERFPNQTLTVDYEIKNAKLGLLWRMFQSRDRSAGSFLSFESYREQTVFWLRDYSLFKVLKEELNQASWELWPAPFREHQPDALSEYSKFHAAKIEFQEWLQWQLFLQLKEARHYAEKESVLIMGDLPFLVSRDSADVWAHQNYFKLGRVSGAPPDAYFANGQRWAMPPYDWRAMEQKGFDLLVQRLKYAEHFYHCFRIDHAVGLFRIWTIPVSAPPEEAGLNGTFDPEDEKTWEDHGKKLLNIIIQNTSMLPCAEDLGVVPECSFRTLEACGIPGTDVQRWAKDEAGSYAFKPAKKYRNNSAAVVSTHDSSSFKGWWLYEAGTVDEVLFKRICGQFKVDYERVKPRLFDLEHSGYGRLRWRAEVNSLSEFKKITGLKDAKTNYLVYLYENSFDEQKKYLNWLQLGDAELNGCSLTLRERALLKACETSSIFSIQILQDWLSLGNMLDKTHPWEYRINFPGVEDGRNWSLRMPLGLEEMLQLPVNDKIKMINIQTDRMS